MEKFSTIMLTILVRFLLCTPESRANAEDGLGQEKLTKLRFYVQDIVSGESPTVWKVGQSNLTDILPSAFGLVSVVDSLVTSGTEMDSGELGRIQGIIGLSDFHEKALVMLLNIVFTNGTYKGSALSILRSCGRCPLLEARELLEWHVAMLLDHLQWGVEFDIK